VYKRQDMIEGKFTSQQFRNRLLSKLRIHLQLSW